MNIVKGASFIKKGRVFDDVFACYQCCKCSAGCPVAFAMDLLPHQIIRHLIYHDTEKALASHTIWMCASCQTCNTRCPNEIDIAGVMDELRHMHIQSGRYPAEPATPLFHHTFLNEIQKHGRIHELSLMQRYTFKRRKLPGKGNLQDMLYDMKLGLKLFLRGKISLWPHRGRSRSEVAAIFKHEHGNKKT